MVDQVRGGLRGAEPATLAAEGEQLVVAAVGAAQPQEAVRQDAALEKGVELVLDVGGQARIRGRLDLGEEGLGVLLYHHGHAVLARSAVLASDQPKAFDVRPLAEAALKSTLCLAVSTHKPVTPLVKRADRMLRELLLARAARAAQP